MVHTRNVDPLLLREGVQSGQLPFFLRFENERTERNGTERKFIRCVVEEGRVGIIRRGDSTLMGTYLLPRSFLRTTGLGGCFGRRYSQETRSARQSMIIELLKEKIHTLFIIKKLKYFFFHYNIMKLVEKVGKFQLKLSISKLIKTLDFCRTPKKNL